MNSDRDGIRGGWATPGDDQSDAESAVETTGEFTIDYAPPAWYTQNASGSSEGASPTSSASSASVDEEESDEAEVSDGSEGSDGAGPANGADGAAAAGVPATPATPSVSCGFRAFLRAWSAFRSARRCSAAFCSCFPLYSCYS